MFAAEPEEVEEAEEPVADEVPELEAWQRVSTIHINEQRTACSYRSQAREERLAAGTGRGRGTRGAFRGAGSRGRGSHGRRRRVIAGEAVSKHGIPGTNRG
jgi:hypothetical protein